MIVLVSYQRFFVLLCQWDGERQELKQKHLRQASHLPIRQEVTTSPPVFTRLPAPEPPNSRTQHDVAIQLPTTPRIEIQPVVHEIALLY